MKQTTSIILLSIHLLGFVLLLTGQSGGAANFLVALGMCIEFPGFFLARLATQSLGTVLAITFVVNAALYYGAGLLIDFLSRPR